MFGKEQSDYAPRRVFIFALIALSNLFMAALAGGVIVVLLLLPGLPDIETIKSLHVKVQLRV